MKKIICLSFAMICIVIYGFSSKANAAFGDLNKTYPDTRSQVPDRCELGNATFVKSGVAKQKDVINYKKSNNENHIGIVDKLYVIYKYDNYINSSIHNFTNNINIEPNTTYKDTYEFTKNISISCEEEVHNEVSVNCTSKLNGNAKLFKIANLGVSTDLEIKGKVSEITKTNYNAEYSVKKTISTEIKNTTDEPMVYRCQLRGTFECYVVQIYEIQYDVTTTTKGGWFWKETFYNYHQNGFKLVEQYTSLKLITGSTIEGYFEMKLAPDKRYVCTKNFGENVINVN